MPRAPRVEYEGAIYHVVARGDRREPIVFDDVDRNMFVKTLSKVCEQTGWEVFAWILLDNHYHLAVRTPESNLVTGMTWFQNTFTRRINTRHGLWGHLFGGRYKAMPVEDERRSGERIRSDYLTTLIDYIHLNPARAGLVDGGERSVQEYSWSSLAQGYARPPSKRAAWLNVGEGLDLFGEKDTVAGRRRYIERLDRWAREEERERIGVPELDGQSLQSTLRRGWYWGSEFFREKLVEQFGSEASRSGDRNKMSSDLARRHDEQGAEGILRAAEELFRCSAEEWAMPIRGDHRRVAVAWALARRTTMPQLWIAQRTGLRTAANVSQRVRRFEQIPDRVLDREIREWKKEMSKFIQ